MAETSAVGAVTNSTENIIVNGSAVTVTVKEFNASINLNNNGNKVKLSLKVGALDLLSGTYKNGDIVRITSNVGNGASKNVTLQITPLSGDSSNRAHNIEWSLRWDQ